MANLKAMRIRLSDDEMESLKQLTLESGSTRKLYEVVNEALDKTADNPPDNVIHVPRAERPYRTIYHCRDDSIERLKELYDCNQTQAIYTALRHTLDLIAANDSER